MKNNKFDFVKFSSLLLVAVAVVFFTSCGSKQAKEAENTSATPKEEAFKSVTKYPIPTALEVIKLLNNAGASYILSLSNPVS